MRKEETEADDGDDYGDNDVDADDGNNNDDGDDAVSHRTADEERGPRLCIFALTCPFNFFCTHPDPLSTQTHNENHKYENRNTTHLLWVGTTCRC